jgi:succinate-semialdehyde dehydrogenase / glutarate-semialdehyde dehydrogenase
MKSINPYTNLLIREYPEHSHEEASTILGKVHNAWLSWKNTPFVERSRLMKAAAEVLRERKQVYASLITQEMGKIIRESVAEIEKCAFACDYYAEHAAEMLRDKPVPSDVPGSFVTFQPLGVVLAVMPWNFPFWQVFRFAAPTLMAGNGAVLKHASNVPGCALAIEEVFRLAGFPQDLFRTLMIPSKSVMPLIADKRIAAITLTGSEAAGSEVASEAARHIKKSVLELGGSDPFIVMEDADLDKAAAIAVTARMINQGQSCIAAKRFIVAEQVADAFEQRIRKAFEAMVIGDPSVPGTQVGPLARMDLVDEIDRQVRKSISMGARLVTGGKRPAMAGCFYTPTIVSGVKPGMPLYGEETFGPVVALITVRSEEEAIAVANDSDFGLGGSVWTRDTARGERIARQVETGAMFINGLVKSDPRLPFGGIKQSGYGRELSEFGIREFVNVKSIWK